MRDMVLVGAVVMGIGLGALFGCDNPFSARATPFQGNVVAVSRIDDADPSGRAAFILLSDGMVWDTTPGDGWRYPYSMLRPPVDVGLIAFWEVTVFVTVSGELWTFDGDWHNWGAAPDETGVECGPEAMPFLWGTR